MSAPMGVWQERLLSDVTATTHTQYSDIVPNGEAWYLRRVAVRNNTTLGSSALVTIDNGSFSIDVHRFNSLDIDKPESEDIGLWLREGERVQVDWSDIVSGDRVTTALLGVKKFRPLTLDEGA